MTPILKKGDKQLIKNYRPISLLPICGKILEKIIFNRLYNYLTANRLITKNQSGVRPGDSTTNQLLYIVDETHQAFDSTECFEDRAVFLDISNAFAKAWHDGLIFKLKQNGTDSSLKLFQNYLSNRKQCVVPIQIILVLNQVYLQALFLVSYYFLFISMTLKETLNQISYDTMLFSLVKDPEISANDLNHDLDTIRGPISVN